MIQPDTLMVALGSAVGGGGAWKLLDFLLARKRLASDVSVTAVDASERVIALLLKQIEAMGARIDHTESGMRDMERRFEARIAELRRENDELRERCTRIEQERDMHAAELARLRLEAMADHEHGEST